MKRSMALIITLLIVLIACKTTKDTAENIRIEAFGEKPTLLRLPYLQLVRPTTATITWKTNATAENCLVEIQQESSSKKIIVKGDLINHEDNMFNEVVLTNLKPETTYSYTIYTNGHAMASGNEYYFTTAPETKDAAFSFYALGDIGATLNESFAEKPAERIKELKIKPDFGLGLGDIIYPYGKSKKYDRQLFKPFQDVFKNTPFYPVPGNHDWYSDPEKNFEMEWRLPGNEHYYSFTYSNALLIGLDSSKGDFYNKEEQILWLKQTLAANKDKYDWTIVFLHHNSRTCAYYKDGAPVMALYKIFAENKVDVVLNGHMHTYERLKPYDAEGNIDASQSEQTKYTDLKNRFISITIGAGGKIKKDWKVDPNNPENCKDGTIVAHAEHVGSFGVFSIDGRTLSFKAINSFTSETFDRFSITK